MMGSAHQLIDLRNNLNASIFEFSGYVFREDAFGIIKRLRYFLEQIENIRFKFNMSIDEVRIIDIGCGTGIGVTIPLAMAGYVIQGIDMDQASIDQAIRNTEGIPNISFSCQEISDLSVNEPFHVAVCSEVLEHVDHPDEFLKQIKNLLIDDGLLLVTVPNGYGYFELESLIYERFPGFVSYIDLVQQAMVERYGSNTLQERHERERSKDYCDMACPSLDRLTTHCNKFTSRRIKKLLENNNYQITDFRSRTFLAGNIINVIIRESDKLLSLNGRVADFLPKWMCSDWLIASRNHKLSPSVSK